MHCLGAINVSTLRKIGLCICCANLHGAGNSVDPRAHRDSSGVYVCKNFIAHQSSTPLAMSPASRDSSASTARFAHSVLLMGSFLLTADSSLSRLGYGLGASFFN